MNKHFLLGLALCAVSLCAMEQNSFTPSFANRTNAERFLAQKEMEYRKEEILAKDYHTVIHGVKIMSFRQSSTKRRLFSKEEDE